MSAVVVLACLPAIAAAQVGGYRLDPVHTRIVFAIEHAGYSQAIGTVSGSIGQLAFDPDDWHSARLSVEVPLQRLDMGDADWTRAVIARRFLDVARYPVARFVSSSVEPIDAGNIDSASTGARRAASAQAHMEDRTPRQARVCGTLSLHGIDRPLCMDVTFNQLKRYPLPPFRSTIGFSATAMLKRSDFGINAWQSLVGDEVQLRIEAEAVRGGNVLKAIDENQPVAESTTRTPSDEDAPVPPDEQAPAP